MCVGVLVLYMWGGWGGGGVGCVFFFQAEDGIRDAQESRGLGDVYKRQLFVRATPYWVLNGQGA